MPNHIHLLIKDKKESSGDVFAGFLTSFVIWYNAKYRRTGHLFERKFRSRPVESETCFLRVFRYIHRNPFEAKLCGRMEDYPYSSFAYYFRSGRYNADDLILGLMTKNDFEKYHYEKDRTDDILNVFASVRLTDAEIISLINRSGIDNISNIKDLPSEIRTMILQKLLLEGATYRQINELTGIRVSVIRTVSRELHQNS